MAKKIIILDARKTPAGDTNVGAVFWYPVAVNVQTLPGFQSAYSGSTGPEVTALQNGTVVEEPYSATYSQGTSKPQIQTALVTAYNAALAVFNARFIPKQYFGTFWDGTTWT